MRKPTVADLDQPLFFALSTTLVVVALAALIGLGLKRLGWTGPAAIFGQSAA